ncbi:BTB domain and ankyrin repeat protein [Aspergillus lucknowensis]|uniref:BTB domain-containing protein n=1 Tax=Aspergillus lucknowensis TaxID=176173 RepID=A0ABR4M321_9EURO
MSSNLWEFFFRDDVESFQRYLAGVSYTPSAQRAPGTGGGGASNLNTIPRSPGRMISSSLGVSPKTKRLTGTSPATYLPDRGSGARPNKNLSRDELNSRDRFGRTLLHHVASSPKPTAPDFALALLELPYIDIYAQDLESGWTALHRALYAGNATIAQALMIRDAQDATDLSKPGASGHPTGNLIKIKDREGYSPFDVYAATINFRDARRIVASTDLDASLPELNDASSSASSEEEDTTKNPENPKTNLFGDEVYTFGSNKNLNLGVGDQNDRQFPERITLNRPDHLQQRLFWEHQERHQNQMSAIRPDSNISQDLPAFIKAKPIKFKAIAMSKLHTAILTNDPESNLFMCGFGPGGRLGTGDETTRFSFVCINGGGLAHKKVASIALGQDHTLAITDCGDIFSWGSNKSGQLGYNLPKTSNKDDVPIQQSPRQIFNPFKKEVILGAAASAIHSVVFSSSGLYTFGKNEGQLGLVDSDARSLDVQTTPRRVGASLLSTPIQSVSAIDQATAILLQNHEVWVFSNYGYSKLSFPLEIHSRFIRDSFMATRYDTSINRIVKIRSGGNTICALSSSGDVFTTQVNKLENLPSLTSTTNPSKIRNSLSTPVRVWSVKRAHMAVKDVDVGQDGSIIICTTSGSAWRKEKRRKAKGGPSKDYKFARIPGLTRAVGVCSNAFGAFAVTQRECDVTREQINVDPTSFWEAMLPLSPFNSVLNSTNSVPDKEVLCNLDTASTIKQVIMSSPSLDSYFPPTPAGPPTGTVWLMTTASNIRVPVHEFILTGRSSALRKAFHEFRVKHSTCIPDLLIIEKDETGQCQVIFQGVDIWAVLNIAFFLYSDNVFDVWHQARYSPENAPRYRQVRTDVIRIATQLNLPALERAAVLMARPLKSIKGDFATALSDPAFYESADVVIDLNDDQMAVHSQVICQRCPFFRTLFHGRSGGRWLSSRRTRSQDKIHVDLKHIDRSVFEFVHRYMYTNIDDRLFDHVRTRDTEEFIDLIIDVAFVANELMIDRLAQICQKALGKFVTSRNVCHLLNVIAPCFVTEFKDAALEYICLNLEDLISNKLLGDLDEHLLRALDHVCHDNQLTAFPISRGRNSMDYILEKYPELVSLIGADKRRLIDSMRLKSRLGKVESYEGKPRVPSEKVVASPSASKLKTSLEKDATTGVHESPFLRPQTSASDLVFQMDDEQLPSSLDPGKGKAVNRGSKSADGSNSRPWNGTSGLSSSLQDTESFRNRSHLDGQTASPRDAVLAKAPPDFQTPTAPAAATGLASPPQPPQTPWGSAAISGSKKTLKDIMTESSENRVSGLSLGMSARREPSANFASKLSQKERKKIQQQQMQEKVSAQGKAKEGPQNPWRILPQTEASAVPFAASQNAPRQDLPNPTPPKSVHKSGMTLRQTVAGAPSPKSQSPSPSMQSKGRTQPPPARPPNSEPSAAPSTSPKQPSNAPFTIKSVRHIPRPEPYKTNLPQDTSSSMSLSTIFMQQQTEKDEIREAATAKHNLQDIQAEQAFQEWWDKESRRVQGLPEPESESATGPDGRNDRGRRSGHNNKGSAQRKRRGKGPVLQDVSGSASSPRPGQQDQRLLRNGPELNIDQNGSPGSRRGSHWVSPLHHETQRKTRVDSITPDGPSRRGGRGGGVFRGNQRGSEKA